MSQSVVDNLRQSVSRYPDRCAIQSADRVTSYGSLSASAAAVAAFLRSGGLRAEDRVAIALPNSAEYVIAYYGSLMAGAVVVPLNTAAKAKDLGVWLNHSEAAWLFADSRNSEIEPALHTVTAPLKVVWVGEHDREGIAFGETLERKGLPLEAAPDGSQPATIMYTSGTTGRPKGVLLSHRNLASNAEAIVAYLELVASDSIVNVLPFYYSYGNSVLHSHLLAGACMILRGNLVFPHTVVEALAESRATGFAGVPSTFALLLSRVKLSQYDLSSLRYITQAGGPMTPVLAERLCAALPATRLVVMYGQTEATARIAFLPPDDLPKKIGSVGVPIPGVEIQVRCESGGLARAAEVGEVWVRGPSVMMRYWRDDEATNAVLRDDWLKTGDLGYLDSDGYLYIRGRRSDIIKVGAHRIHPSEVEEIIAEIAGVQEVAVVGIEDEVLGQVIKAFVVTDAASAPKPAHIQGYCRERLASYKIPKYVEFVKSLPKTASGKVRRADLARGV